MNGPSLVYRRDRRIFLRVSFLLLICFVSDLSAQEQNHSPSVRALEALGPELSALLQQADSIRIYRLRAIVEASGRRMAGYPVLEEVVLTRPADLRLVRAAFFDEKTYSDYQADCFVPHHAIRLDVGKRQITLIVCFTCNQIRRVGEGKTKVVISIQSVGPLRDTLETILNRRKQGE